MPSLLSSFLDLMLPHRCPFCDSICREPLCPDCTDAVRFISPPFCIACGVPFKSDSIKNHTCGECMKKKRLFSWARGVLIYNDASAKAIHRFKYNKDTTFSKALGSIISRYHDLEGFDVLIPVPLHIDRLRERGFNQSLLLAAWVSRSVERPLWPDALQRIRWTESQITLDRAQRRSNVRGAFRVRRPRQVAGRRVILVDDVYTTGATANECARVLRGAGAEEVYVITLARIL